MNDRQGGRRGFGGPRRGFQGRNNQRDNNFFAPRRKVCPVKLEDINWKNTESLRYFIGEQGELRPRRKTGATAKIQRRAAAVVKLARHMALLPYTREHIRIMSKP